MGRTTPNTCRTPSPSVFAGPLVYFEEVRRDRSKPNTCRTLSPSAEVQFEEVRRGRITPNTCVVRRG